MFAIHSHATESQQPKKIGFAGISAIISVGKGILIPFFQKYMFEQRSAAVQRGLDALLSPLTLEVLVDQLPGPVQARKVGRTLQELVREDSRDVLKRLNVGESELFHPIHQLRSDWLNDLLKLGELGDLREGGLGCSHRFLPKTWVNPCQSPHEQVITLRITSHRSGVHHFEV